MRQSLLAGIGIFVLCLAAVGTPLAVADSEYSVTSDQSIDVPDRTVEQGGDTFTIREISRTDPGDSISVTAEAPDDADATLYLYNSDNAIVDAREGTGTSTFDFTLENDSGVGYESGTYAFVLQHDGAREAVHPLVVRGYSISTDSPSAVSEGEDVTISADVDKLRGEDMERVEIVVANDETTLRKDADEESQGTYSATIETEDLSAGTYDVYATVQGPEQALGQNELLGLSDPQPMEIEAEESTETPTDDDSQSGGGGGGGGTSGEDSETTSSEQTASDTTPSNQDQDEQSQNVAESITKEIVDENSDTSGVSVSVDTETLTEITFTDEAVQASGDFTVQRHSVPSSTFTQQFEESDVITSVNIQVPPAAANSQATLQFTLNDRILNNRQPENLAVVREVDGGLQLIPTEVTTTQSGVVVTAETPGFSEFAVVQVDQSSEGTTTEATETADSTTDTDPTTPSTQSESSADGDKTGTNDTEETTGVGSTPFVEALVVVLAIVVLGARWNRD